MADRHRVGGGEHLHILPPTLFAGHSSTVKRSPPAEIECIHTNDYLATNYHPSKTQSPNDIGNWASICPVREVLARTY
jgi:hypothetical protein